MLVILKKLPQWLPGSGEVDLLRERGARTRLQTLEAGRQQRGGPLLIPLQAARAEPCPGLRDPLPGLLCPCCVCKKHLSDPPCDRKWVLS